jgi:5-(carboxyamino)imidazole ribonucleotide synthase
VTGSDAPAPVLPPAVLGMLGGGQLGRYFVMAAHELGYRVWVLDPDPDSPAGRVADRHLVTGYGDDTALDEMASGCAAVSTEFENVPAAALDRLAVEVIVRPSAAAVATCQDRIVEKTFLREHGLPVGPVAFVATETDLEDVDDALFPAVLKRARFGYDGKGQAMVADRVEARAAFADLGSVPCVLEHRLQLDRELSVVLARGADGAVVCFPTAENRHRNSILDVTITPARVGPEQDVEARSLATHIAESLDYVGVLGVELFVSDGRLLINELAPRPHNSGHVTLDATSTSQFEQQVRALCGLPLGSARAWSSAVMINLLGDLWELDDRRQPTWAAIHAEPDVAVHLYGKSEPRPGRKMGHLTLLGEDRDQLVQRAESLRGDLGISD